jgi:hypothetical protein
MRLTIIRAQLTAPTTEWADLRQRIKDYLASDENQTSFLSRLQAILNRLEPQDLAGFDLTAWKANVPGFGRSLSDICGDGEAWARINTSTLPDLARSGPAAHCAAQTGRTDDRTRQIFSQTQLSPCSSGPVRR